jgi:hypothetical protein
MQEYRKITETVLLETIRTSIQYIWLEEIKPIVDRMNVPYVRNTPPDPQPTPKTPVIPAPIAPEQSVSPTMRLQPAPSKLSIVPCATITIRARLRLFFCPTGLAMNAIAQFTLSRIQSQRGSS